VKHIRKLDHTPNMPNNKDYISYTNHVAAKKFVFAISESLEGVHIGRMSDSHFYSLMLDESTYHSV